MPDRIFLDTNVILYSIAEDVPLKFDMSRKLLNDKFCVSPQIIFECINVCIKKFKYSKPKAIEFAQKIVNSSTMIVENDLTVSKALQLYHKHSLQVFDSKIVATALVSGCNILYSEDLQHKQVFERKLKIINPFK